MLGLTTPLPKQGHCLSRHKLFPRKTVLTIIKVEENNASQILTTMAKSVRKTITEVLIFALTLPSYSVYHMVVILPLMRMML